MPIREKNHRLDRELYKGIVSVSFTLCIVGKKQAFIEPVIIKTFTDLLAVEAKKTSCKIPVFCFMPDHLHLLIEGTSSDADTWKTIVDFKQKSGFWLASNRPGIKWQKDFYDHIIRSDEKIAVQARYILDNPTRKGIVQHWQDYPYNGSIGYALNEVLNGII